jgi:N,N'-diacetyllegionaminate synthase
MKDKSPYIIAEVGMAHDGNLNFAHAFIDMVAKTGADAIKFQTHLADYESSPLEPWRIRFSRLDGKRIDYWRRTEFSRQEWIELASHCESVGLAFMSSPFSIEAAKVLESCRMKIWKIASGELLNYPLIDYLSERRVDLLLSTGLAEEGEVDEAVSRIIGRGGNIIGVLECTSKYPTPLNEVNLIRMRERGVRLNKPYGLSDHSGDVAPACIAMTLGASFIEVHVAVGREAFGPDTSASLTGLQVREIVDFRQKLSLLHNGGTQDQNERTQMKQRFRKSIYLGRAMQAGEKVTLNDLRFLKPMAGIGAEFYEQVIGRVAARDLSEGAPLEWDSLK